MEDAAGIVRFILEAFATFVDNGGAPPPFRFDVIPQLGNHPLITIMVDGKPYVLTVSDI